MLLLVVAAADGVAGLECVDLGFDLLPERDGVLAGHQAQVGQQITHHVHLVVEDLDIVEDQVEKGAALIRLVLLTVQRNAQLALKLP